MEQRRQIIKKIENIDNLPTLPSIAIAVNQLLKDYDSPMQDLVAMLEKDQSLTMKILRLVNSSFFGFKSKVNAIGHAVTLLGYNTVQNAVVTVSVIEALSIKNDLDDFEIDHFWEHSISVAVLSKYIASHTKLTPPEDAFTSGLLHDIGKIIWVNFFPDFFIRIMQMVKKEKMTFYDAEKILKLPPHSLIGSVLAKRWMLPTALVECIKYHHSGNEGTPLSYLTEVVCMSDRILHMMEGDNSRQLDLASFDKKVRVAATHFFQNKPDWLKNVKIEMATACDFLKRGVT